MYRTVCGWISIVRWKLENNVAVNLFRLFFVLFINGQRYVSSSNRIKTYIYRRISFNFNIKYFLFKTLTIQLKVFNCLIRQTLIWYITTEYKIFSISLIAVELKNVIILNPCFYRSEKKVMFLGRQDLFLEIPITTLN